MIKLESKRKDLVDHSGRYLILAMNYEIEKDILYGIRRQIPKPIRTIPLATFYGHLFSVDIHVSKLFSSSQNPNV